MDKIKRLIEVKPFISILTLPFVFFLILDGLNPLIILFSVLMFLVDYNFKANKIHFYFYSFLLFILYSKILFDDTKLTLHDFRLRHFSLIFFTLSVFISYLIYKKRVLVRFINAFFFFFSISILITGYLNNFKTFEKSIFLKSLNFKYNSPDFFIDKSNDPLIFIVLDGFSSTSEIYNVTNDSIDYELDIYLKSKGFLVYNNSKSRTERTSLSLPSIFNFNLHNSFKNDSIESLDKGLQIIDGFDYIFRDNLLVDSLNLKSVKSFSYGLLPFKNGINDKEFYYYWEDMFLESAFFNRIFNKTIIGTYLDGIERETKYVDSFRKQSLDSFHSLTPQKNSFYYFHFFFPHDPYSYLDEYPKNNLNFFTISEEKYLNEHIKYKRWFSKKFISLLENKLLGNSRVIITGDHGFRHNSKISPILTNIYFKGYEAGVTDKVEYVQDLGYLINRSF